MYSTHSCAVDINMWTAVTTSDDDFTLRFPTLARVLHAPDPEPIDLLDESLPASAWDSVEKVPCTGLNDSTPPHANSAVGPNPFSIQVNVDICRQLHIRDPMLARVHHERGVDLGFFRCPLIDGEATTSYYLPVRPGVRTAGPR